MKSTANMTYGKSLAENSKTEQLSRKILPILIRQAQSSQTITYGQLAEEVNTNPHGVIGKCLGIIGNVLNEIPEDAGFPRPPLINAIVVNKNTQEPSQGLNEFLERELDPLSTRIDRSVAIRLSQEKSFQYTHWPDVLKYFGLKSAAPFRNVTEVIQKSQQSGGGGEGEEHIDFKKRVQQHPELFSMGKKVDSTTEYALPSGDSIDVVFQKYDRIVAVEVKSRKSCIKDILRGLFQTIKYAAVLDASEKTTETPRRNIKVFLALEASFPPELISIRNTLNISVYDNLGDKI